MPATSSSRAQVGNGGAFNLVKGSGNDWSGPTFTVNPRSGVRSERRASRYTIFARNAGERPHLHEHRRGRIQAGTAAAQGPIANVVLETTHDVGPAARTDHRHAARPQLGRDRDDQRRRRLRVGCLSRLRVHERLRRAVRRSRRARRACARDSTVRLRRSAGPSGNSRRLPAGTTTVPTTSAGLRGTRARRTTGQDVSIRATHDSSRSF